MSIYLIFALDQHRKNSENRMINTFSKSWEIFIFQACDAPLICNQTHLQPQPGAFNTEIPIATS